MATRSLNKVQLIGNLTRDPELRYTPQGTAVCTFGMATNRQWVTESGEKREEADFHRIVTWSKLAEICSQLLSKGKRVYIEGRLSTRSWTAQDGSTRQTTEVVASDMIILDSRMAGGEIEVPAEVGEEVAQEAPPDVKSGEGDVGEQSPQPTKTGKKQEKKEKKEVKESSGDNEEMPF